MSEVRQSLPRSLWLRTASPAVIHKYSESLHLNKLIRKCKSACLRLRNLCQTAARERRLYVKERVALGDKNQLLIAEIDGRCFLLGAGVSGVVMLANLDSGEPFKKVLQQKMRPETPVRKKTTGRARKEPVNAVQEI